MNEIENGAMAADNSELGTLKAIDSRSREARADGRSIEDLDTEPARRMAREDLGDLHKLKTPKRLDHAAVVIHGNMRNPAYKAEFERADYEAAKGVELLAQAGATPRPRTRRAKAAIGAATA